LSYNVFVHDSRYPHYIHMSASLGNGRNLTRPVVNYELAFTTGHSFTNNHWRYEIEVRPIANICLPTGKIVASDPSQLDQRVDHHFARTVPPGRYPVDLAIRHFATSGDDFKDSRVACMRIRFQNEPVSEWLMAATAEEELDALFNFEICGYSVDVGMGSFADSSGLHAILREYQEQSKTLHEEFYSEQVLPTVKPTELFAEVILDQASRANLVISESGEGDGFYASYWGLAQDGSAVCLVTDFGLLTKHIYDIKQIGPVPTLIGTQQQLELPGGAATLRVVRANPKLLVLRLTGIGMNTSECDIYQRSFCLPKEGPSICECDGEMVHEFRYKGTILDDSVIVVKYLDRIVAL